MSKALNDIILQLQQYSTAQMAGAVKTFPLRELMKNGQVIQEMLQHGEQNDSYTEKELEIALSKLQEVMTKRVDAAQTLVAKFSTMSPEVIALNNSIFALVPSRDVIEDVKAAYLNAGNFVDGLTAASANILEAVNIEIQQRFSLMSPEAIAVSYSGSTLDSYRKLLKNLLIHIEVDSDIFKVYSRIMRNVIEGCRIYDSQINASRTLCEQIFVSASPDFDRIFNEYAVGDLELYDAHLKETLAILELDITRRPSIVEFTEQCCQTHEALTRHFIARKLAMRKTTRVLQLSHYISFLSTEQVAENAAICLMSCHILFEEARTFLLTQKGHLDVKLNLASIEEAQKKIAEGLHYRQFAIGQLFQELSKLSPQDLNIVSKKRLRDSYLLLQEILCLTDEYIARTPSDPQSHILDLAQNLRKETDILQEGITPVAAASANRLEEEEPWELERHLPNLSKFYDAELIGLIRKTVESGQGASSRDDETFLRTAILTLIPTEQLYSYIESFINFANIR